MYIFAENKQQMKRHLKMIIGTIIAIIAVLVLGSVVQIGDKLGALTGPVVEYIFYIVIAALTIAFIVIPIVKVQAAPEMPALTTDGQPDADKLSSLGRKLVSNCEYIPDKDARKEHKAELSKSLGEAAGDTQQLTAVINKEIDYRLKGDKDTDGLTGVVGIDKRIREWAKTVFLVTAISQNSKADSIALLAINHKMIEDIVTASGFRPTRPQMVKLYTRVVGTAVVSYIASDAISDFTFQLGESSEHRFFDSIKRMKLPGIILGSALDGALNALMTLRIGYVTKSYILQGSKALDDKKNKKEIRAAAIKESHKTIPSIIIESAGVIGKSAAGKLIKLFTKTEEETMEFDLETLEA